MHEDKESVCVRVCVCVCVCACVRVCVCSYTTCSSRVGGVKCRRVCVRLRVTRECRKMQWEMLTHADILETHTLKICLSMTSSVDCVTPALTPGSLHSKVTNGWPAMISRSHSVTHTLRAGKQRQRVDHKWFWDGILTPGPFILLYFNMLHFISLYFLYTVKNSLYKYCPWELYSGSRSHKGDVATQISHNNITVNWF